MKMYALLVAVLSLASFGAFADDVAIGCSILETPTSTNDSWSIYILNDRAAFFDNDHWSYATRAKDIDTGGGSTYQLFKSEKDGDQFHINLDDPSSLTGPNDKIYAELYFYRSHRPQIFECVKTTVEEAKDAFQD